MGLGLGKPKQIFVFGSVWVLTEYWFGNRGWRLSTGAVPSTNFLRRQGRQTSIFFFGKYNTVVNGTKDRKGVFNSTSEQY